jgi:7,8-dihydropterin-6-yl-methyl-4-(beta-D-ribofuranosyl)aminobenzene 5'-phosphate synthase
MLAAGVGTTGSLARSLFFLGLCEEQALVARIRDKGLVVITGCGHPTVEVILRMVRRLSGEPVYAIAGGIHFPVTKSRSQRRGVQVQMLFGTGKPPWQRISDNDLGETISHINESAPREVLLSAHDTCDHALARMDDELNAETKVLKAGDTYRLPGGYRVIESG